MKIVYFDPACGVSGDMFSGALLDLGLDFAGLQDAVASLRLNVMLKAEDVMRGGLRALKFDVLSRETGSPVENAPEHTHRHLSDIQQIIDSGKLSKAVKTDALAVFGLIAEAEAKAHGTTKDHVHFHEVGAVDAIVDVVAGAWLFNELHAEAVCGPVNVGGGTVMCQHGELPVPVPAVAELLKGMIAYSDGIKSELATPTGVALLKHFCVSYGSLPKMTVEATGYGAGTKEFARPNIFRATLGLSL